MKGSCVVKVMEKLEKVYETDINIHDIFADCISYREISTIS
jgi:hypothetical protein